jgi:hypothetical protein
VSSVDSEKLEEKHFGNIDSDKYNDKHIGGTFNLQKFRTYSCATMHRQLCERL